MMNKVMLIGRLGTDPELSTTNNGTHVCKFSLATSKKNAEGEKTEWHNIVLWKNNAENAAKFLAKGSMVYIEGEITTRSYEKDGLKKFFTDINGFSCKFLDTKKSDTRSVPPSLDDIPF